jgi:hypothetical protein
MAILLIYVLFRRKPTKFVKNDLLTDGSRVGSGNTSCSTEEVNEVLGVALKFSSINRWQ